jgi:hypothetical protein
MAIFWGAVIIAIAIFLGLEDISAAIERFRNDYRLRNK